MRFPAQLADALVAIHSIDPASIPGIADVDQVDRYREVLDTVGQPHPDVRARLQMARRQPTATDGSSSGARRLPDGQHHRRQ